MSLADEGAKLTRLAERKKTTADAAAEAAKDYKAQEHKLLELMARERQASFRPEGLSFLFRADRERVKGQVDDRGVFFDWALGEEPSLLKFIDDLVAALGVDHQLTREGWTRELHEALKNLTFLKLAERQELLNRWARKNRDDKAPMPPGTAYRPDPFVSVTKS
jgi:hypothetical protein